MQLSKFLMALIILCGFVISPSVAHEGATGVVKHRMHLMKNLGKGMKQMRGMAKGKVKYDHDAYRSYIQDLKKGSTNMLDLFPEGSLQSPTEARPSIWKKWNNFEDLANKLSEESTLLEQHFSEKNEVMMGKQLKRVGKVCLECHKKYRKKKK